MRSPGATARRGIGARKRRARGAEARSAVAGPARVHFNTAHAGPARAPQGAVQPGQASLGAAVQGTVGRSGGVQTPSGSEPRRTGCARKAVHQRGVGRAPEACRQRARCFRQQTPGRRSWALEKAGASVRPGTAAQNCGERLRQKTAAKHSQAAKFLPVPCEVCTTPPPEGATGLARHGRTFEPGRGRAVSSQEEGGAAREAISAAGPALAGEPGWPGRSWRCQPVAGSGRGSGSRFPRRSRHP